MKRGLDVNVNVNFGTAPPSSQHVDVEAALLAATSMGVHVQQPVMPWQSTPLLRSVFSRDKLPWLHPLKIPRSFPAVSVSGTVKSTITVEAKKLIIRDASHETAGSSREIERDQVLLKWLEVVLLAPEESRVGKQIMAADVENAEKGAHLQILADTLMGKATRTLNLRVSSLLLYVRWLRMHSPFEDFLPFSEEAIYDYMCSLRTAACSATRGTTFLSTLAFVKALLGMSGATECMESPRIAGAALAMYLTKRPLKQAPALDPVMLAILDFMSFCERNLYLRCMAGFCLMCIYGRLRVSDMHRIVNLSVRGEFVEGSLMRVKTARTKEKQSTFLPCVVPCKGMLGLNWFSAFTFNRECLGLPKFHSLESTIDDRTFMVMPSEQTCESTNQERVSTSEVTAKLKMLLGKSFPAETVNKITSHSLKTTVLTYMGYMGTYGVDYTHTELLGYHLTQHRSAINYQRSALSAPLRTMCGMLKEVQEGKFLPLAPRDEVFCRDTKPKGVLEQMLQTMGMELQELCEKFLGFPATSLHEGDAHPELRALWEMMGQPFMQEVPVVEQVDSPTEVVSNFGYEDADRVRDDPATDGSGDESNCSDSCSSTAESALASVVRDSEFATFRPVSKSAVTEMVYRHKRTKMIHYGHDSFESKTACGRALGSTYFRFFGDIEKAWPHCRNCFGSM